MIQLATLCYIRAGGKTLMLHRVKKDNDIHAGKWNGLGGKFEAGETPEACVIREVQEESGFLIIEPKLAGVLTFPQFKPNEDWVVFVFTVDQFEGTQIESNEGNLQWIKDEKLSALNLWEGDLLFMKWISDGRFFSGKLIYENKQLKSHAVCFY